MPLPLSPVAWRALVLALAQGLSESMALWRSRRWRRRA